MIHPDAQQAIERSEDWRPKRLRRDDVAALRALYAQVMACQQDGWEARQVTIWLPRGKSERAVARLGKATPAVTVKAKWGTRHVLGLDVTVTAHMELGARARNFKLKVAEHRFRAETGQTQFCRETAHAVRLGLGWCAWKTG